MSTLQSKTIEAASEMKVIILCPGISKNEINVSFNKKEGILEIFGEPKKSEVSEEFDLEVKGKLQIPAKFRSDEVSFSVNDGVGIIKLGLAKDVQIIKAS